MISLSYSALLLQLPNPQRGNSTQYDLHQLVNRAMDGSYYAYKMNEPMKRFKLSFSGVNRPKILEIIDFLRGSAGQEIWYTDPQAVVWHCKLLTEPFDAEHAAPRNNTFSLELEVVA